MRRSRRLAAKKAFTSETEESSQEEIVNAIKQDAEASILKDSSSVCDFIIDKTSSKVIIQDGDHEDNNCEGFTFYDKRCDEHFDDLGEKKVVKEDLDGDDDDDQKKKSTNLPEEDFITLSTESKEMITNSSGLSSELQVDIDTEDLYLKFDRNIFKPVSLSKSFTELTFNDTELMKKSVITSDFEKRSSAPPMHVSSYALKKQRKKAREETAGPMWFNLPATQITPEIEQDMKIMKMRNVLDKKRHYKKNDTKALPKYFQIGTIVEGSADFYSSRIPKRQRKSTLIDELLSDAEFRRCNKKKYLEIQAAKQSGRKRVYTKKMKRRKPNGSRA
ncbi:uncharacterized protein [Montipora foliosa]|uniref:uncharacterized protein n=1 Tax=Montipora foliosa TaxID=591990 RepID=UPI0035F161FD